MFDALLHAVESTLGAKVHPATITNDNGDGTVNLVSHDGHDTPHENVPFFHPADALERPVGAVWAEPHPDTLLSPEDKQTIRDESDAQDREDQGGGNA